MPKTIRSGFVAKLIAIGSGLEARSKSLIKGVESGLTARLNAIGSWLESQIQIASKKC